jgi:nitrous oxide reductase accessory protein NosL
VIGALNTTKEQFMLKRRFAIIAVLTMVFVGMAEIYVLAQDDLDSHRSCARCGMDRKAYGYSRMLVLYEDGAMVGTCSLHCAVVELDANRGRTLKSILVADRDSRALIDVERAIWVMGGGKRGVMTQQPTWAFQSKAGAEAFTKANGGKIVTWAEALAAAREELVQKH